MSGMSSVTGSRSFLIAKSLSEKGNEFMPDVNIRQEGSHYAVYVDGKFYCSADTYLEAVQELVKDGIL